MLTNHNTPNSYQIIIVQPSSYINMFNSPININNHQSLFSVMTQQRLTSTDINRNSHICATSNNSTRYNLNTRKIGPSIQRQNKLGTSNTVNIQNNLKLQNPYYAAATFNAHPFNVNVCTSVSQNIPIVPVSPHPISNPSAINHTMESTTFAYDKFNRKHNLLTCQNTLNINNAQQICLKNNDLMTISRDAHSPQTSKSKQILDGINDNNDNHEMHHKNGPKCALCNKQFSRVSNLNAHLKSVHSRNRPFKCQFCHKGFSQKHR